MILHHYKYHKLLLNKKLILINMIKKLVNFHQNNLVILLMIIIMIMNFILNRIFYLILIKMVLNVSK
jgi:hypothetical protein